MARSCDPGNKREGVPLTSEQATRLARLDVSILRGVADADAGRVHELDTVLKALNKRWAK